MLSDREKSVEPLFVQHVLAFAQHLSVTVRRVFWRPEKKHTMTVYRIDAGRKEAAAGTVNVLPTAVDFTGVVPNGTSNWDSYRETDKDGSPVNYLRGRKLVGAAHSIEGYKAILFEKSEDGSGSQRNEDVDGDGHDDDVSGEARDEYRNVCSCDTIVLYEHQVKPSVQNDQVERLADWIDITSYINDV